MSLQENIRLKYPGLYNKLVHYNNVFRAKSFHRKAYSQFGEDLLIAPLFEPEHKGFYVDIGAHRPTQRSNTFYFYERGWRGINVEAMPGSKKLFDAVRSRDINVEAAVSDTPDKLTYYQLNQPLMNGFYAEDDELLKREDVKVVDTKEIQMRSLENILDEHLPPGQNIDFLSVDVEGLDFQVLNSNNWQKYLPKVIVIEILGFELDKLNDYPITSMLKKHGYSFYSRTVHTVIFKLDS